MDSSALPDRCRQIYSIYYTVPAAVRQSFLMLNVPLSLPENRRIFHKELRKNQGRGVDTVSETRYDINADTESEPTLKESTEGKIEGVV